MSQAGIVDDIHHLADILVGIRFFLGQTGGCPFTRIPFAFSSWSNCSGVVSRLAWVRLLARPAPWQQEPKVSSMARSVPTNT